MIKTVKIGIAIRIIANEALNALLLTVNKKVRKRILNKVKEKL